MVKKDNITWNYTGNADVTIGEEKPSKLPKIILFIMLLLLCVAGVLIYHYRQYLYDKIVTPQVWLTNNEINLEVGSNFDAESYIYDKTPTSEQYTVILPDTDSVQTDKIGTYEAVYELKSDVGVKDTTLTVHVVDTTAPVIKLKQTDVTLTRDVDTFNAKDYFDSVTDNYDASDSITMKFQDAIDWSQDHTEVIYEATDTSGNSSTAKLEVTIKAKPSVEQPTPIQVPEPTPNNNLGGNTAGGNTSGNTTGGNSLGSGLGASAFYDFSVKTGDSSALKSNIQSMMQNSGASCSVSFSSVNLSVAGTYPVVISGGVNKTIQVTVVE